MATVKINSVQAVGYIEFSMPEGQGGVRLLRGPNGAGKTTALLCLNALLGRKVSLAPSDGAPKGSIEGLGRSITIQKRASASGEVDVPTLEGRFDFSDLVEPAIKDAAARNKARIRSLVGLTAGAASLADFHELFGGQEAFDATVSDEDAPETTDILELADFVKRQTESLARLEEVRIESETSRWQVAVADSKGHDPDKVPQSVAELANAYSEAQRVRLEAASAIRADRESREHNASIVAKLEQHNAKKPSVSMEDALGVVAAAKKMVEDLEAKLATARGTLDEAKRRFQEVMDWEERLTELEGAMLKVSDALPDVEPLIQAENAALEKLQSAEETKRRYDSAVSAKQLGESIQQRQKKATELRALAKRTNEVVTAKLPEGCPLQVKDGVLCAYHDKRKAWIPFDELSEGERWRASLHIAIAAVGEGGIIPVRQEAWQSLDKRAADWVAKQCAEAKVWLISGSVDDEGPLRVESYEPSQN